MRDGAVGEGGGLVYAAMDEVRRTPPRSRRRGTARPQRRVPPRPHGDAPPSFAVPRTLPPAAPALPGIRAVAANDPEVAQEVLVEKAKHFDKSAMLRFSLWNLAGEGLFTSNGELWRRQRKLMAPLFTPKALEAYAADMVGVRPAHRRALERRRRARPGARDDARSRWASPARRSSTPTRSPRPTRSAARSRPRSSGRAGSSGDPSPSATSWRSARSSGSPRATSGPTGEALARGAHRFYGPIALVGQRGRELAHAIAFLDEHVQSMIDERRGVERRAAPIC